MTTAFAQRVLDALGPALADRAGWLLEPFVDGLTSQLAATDAQLQPTDRGWATIFDLPTTDYPALIGQVVGTVVPPGLTLDQQRAYVSDRPNWRRGTPAAMIAAVQAVLVGDSPRVDLTERDGSPWRLTVHVQQGNLPAGGVDVVRAAALTQKPVGIVLNAIDVRTGATNAHMRDLHGPTVADYRAAFATAGAAKAHQPETGTEA